MSGSPPSPVILVSQMACLKTLYSTTSSISSAWKSSIHRQIFRPIIHKFLASQCTLPDFSRIREVRSECMNWFHWKPLCSRPCFYNCGVLSVIVYWHMKAIISCFSHDVMNKYEPSKVWEKGSVTQHGLWIVLACIHSGQHARQFSYLRYLANQSPDNRVSTLTFLWVCYLWHTYPSKSSACAVIFFCSIFLEGGVSRHLAIII